MKKNDYVSQVELSTYRERNKPEVCPILGHAGFLPVVDHDHKTGRIRGVLSSEGNALLGKVENFYRSRCVNGVNELPAVLRALADYLEQEQGPLHPVGTRQLTKRFSRMPKGSQLILLDESGASAKESLACKNSSERTKLYRKQIVK